MSDSTDFERFRELLEASSSRELTDSEVAFLGRMGFQSEECREWLETDAEAVDAWVSEDPLQEVPPPTSLDWARVDAGLRRAGALPTPKQKRTFAMPLLASAAAVLICVGVVYSILRDGLTAPTEPFEDEVVFEVLDLPEGDGSFILHEEEGDDDGVLMIIFSNG